MAVKPNIVKGDTVMIRRGKEKGKRGIVKAVFAEAGQATVEGSTSSSATPSRPRARQHGCGAKRRHLRKGSAASALRAPIRLREMQNADAPSPRSHRRRRRASRLREVRRAGCASRRRERRAMATRLKEKYKSSVRKQLQEKFGYKNVDQIPKLEKVVVNMCVGDAIVNAKALDAGRRRADDDHRSEADRHQGEEVDRGVQAARRHEHRRQGHAARRADVRLPRQALQHRAAAYPRLPRSSGASRSTGAATTTWACASSWSSRRSTSTRSTRRAAWTSRSSRRRRSTKKRRSSSTAMGLAAAETGTVGTQLMAKTS